METVSLPTKFSFKERGSEFIALLFPCETDEDFHRELEQIKREHYSATHHCYGWRVDPFHITEFSSDDGEPSGTAGLPILNAMKSWDLINCGIVVVRYYGGTKLGKPGLIEAYGGAAKEVIEKAALKKVSLVAMFTVNYHYPEERVIQKIIDDLGLRIIEQEYMESVTLEVACDHKLTDRFLHQLQSVEHLGITFQRGGTDHLTST